jgi:class 3 adenylate cyclase
MKQEEAMYWSEYYKQFISPDEEPLEPVSDLYYPIVDEIDRVFVAGSPTYNPGKHNVVGVLAGQFYWRSMLRNILPDRSNGIHVVVSSPCADSFGYQINGPNVTYLGVRDYRMISREDYVVHSLLHDLGSSSRSDYTGAKISGEQCPQSIYVYASNDMKERYITNSPIVFSFAVIAIFAFTSFVFYCYDAKVESRQRFVMHTAERSSAIVSSLFPTSVRDRLYTNPSGNQIVQEPARARSKLQTLLQLNTTEAEYVQADRTMTSDAGAIAELYPETTVLFADISGFTSWSSVRTPTQVFHLLESLFGAFDVIAKKRGIFKVETIGDCYVAVVGLPEPRKHHAVAMARFACDIRNKMRSLVEDLNTTLGPVSSSSPATSEQRKAVRTLSSRILLFSFCILQGTCELALRIGLNSGPTTAGVLRGEKARFQLFGDVS